MACLAPRVYPLKQPKNYEPPVPRWMLKLPEHVTRIHTAYIGVQSHRQTAAVHNAEEAVQAWLNDGDDRPAVVDTFRVVDGWDIADSKTWVA